MARLNKSTRAAKAAKETGIFSLRSSICSIEMNPLRRAASTLPAALCLLPSAFCFLLVPLPLPLRQLLCGLLPYKVGPMAPQTAPSPPLRSPPVLGTQRSRPLRLRRNFMGIHLVFGSVLACLRHAALLWFQHLRFYIMIYVCRVYVCVQSVCVCGYLHCAKAICTA